MTQPTLAVFFEAMPESNGNRNWTVSIHRQDEDIFRAITVSRGEYYDRARYEADSWRYMLGMIPEEPNLLEYDPDLLCPEDHPLFNFNGTFPEHLATDAEVRAAEEFWRGEVGEFNPYTGESRDPRDVETDLHGLLNAPPGAELKPCRG